ncbi:Hypothetical_protein [Hexamita inflata]|uniref:Hypothetical_protein n=1 Tax=Hexamita inflata TaxID=28002 RepID=A0AA86NEB2_9EUKA|nr:Hypothetical protein HINF_LOCUS5590 [Hexamita inflata]
MKYFWKTNYNRCHFSAAASQILGLINISKYYYLNVETESSILSWPSSVSVEVNIYRSYFWIVAVCNRIQAFNRGDEIFLEDKLHRCTFLLQLARFWVYQYFKILYLNVETESSIFPGRLLFLLKQIYIEAISGSSLFVTEFNTFKSGGDEIFLEDKLQQMPLFCCSQLDSGFNQYFKILLSQC